MLGQRWGAVRSQLKLRFNYLGLEVAWRSKAARSWFMSLPRSTRWVTPIAFIVGLGTAQVGRTMIEKRSLESEAVAGVAKPIPVATKNALLRTITHSFYTHSFLQPKKEITIRPNNNVTIRQVRVEVGQKVDKGDVLAFTDSEAQALRAELDSIELKQKDLDYAVTLALAKKSFISDKEFKQRELDHKATKIRKRLAEIETTGSIRSPIAGVVSEISIKSGDYIDNPNQYYIRISDASSFRVQLYLPQSVAARIRKGSWAGLSRKTTDELGKETVELANAKVLGVAPVVDPKSGSVLTDLEVERVPTTWIAGQYVQVTMTVESALNVIAVPNEAIVYENNRPFVYRIDDSDDNGPDVRAPASESNKALQVIKEAVTTGLRDSVYTEIRSGIEVEDRVVVEGQGNLSNSSTVDVVR